MNIEDLKEMVKNCVYEEENLVCMSSEYYQKIIKNAERLNNIIKNIEKCIDYYAIENDDFSKFYNNEEIEILKIIGGDKE